MTDHHDSPSYYLDGRLDLLLSNPVLWLRSFAATLNWDNPANVEASKQVLDEIIERPPLAEVLFPLHEIERFRAAGWTNAKANDPPITAGFHLVNQRASARSRVIGLVANAHESYVVPLGVQRSSRWQVSPMLPFRDIEIQTALSLFARNLSVPSVVPERYEFDISTPLRSLLAQQPPQGPSMNLAALVAILNEIESKTSRLFQTCCVMGTLSGDGHVTASGFAAEKMAAFTREYASGTLLIRPADCEVTARYDDRFDNIAVVTHLRDLVRFLQQQRHLETLTSEQPLSPHEMHAAITRLESAVYRQRDYRTGVDLADRLRQCPKSSQVPFDDRQRLLSLASEVHRHTGSVGVATVTANEMRRELRETGGGTSHDQIAGSDVALAASSFDLTHYAEIVERLHPWLKQMQADPLIFRPLTRVILQNTIGRAWCAMGDECGLPLFRQSMQLQSHFFPGDVSRSENYLIYYAIRLGKLDLAAQHLGDETDWRDLTKISRWMRAFLAADLSRCQNRRWDAPWMDSPDEIDPGWGGPFAFYALATARQPGRTPADIDSRFFRCESMLEHDLRGQQSVSTLSTLLQWVRLARFVYRDDSDQTATTLTRLSETIEAYPDDQYRESHNRFLASFRKTPTKEAIDNILDAIPLI